MMFNDRTDAGRALAAQLQRFADREDVLVLALARGGIPVAREVADALNAPLDVFVVRKLGLPGQEELAMGAIASGGVRVLNDDIIRYLRVPEAVVDDVTRAQAVELERREQLYREGRPAIDVRDRTVILVDDGLATGSTMRAAVGAIRMSGPRRIVVAVPVAARDACEELGAEADECVCVARPEPFFGVGRWYRDFTQTTNDEVRRILSESARAVAPTPAAG